MENQRSKSPTHNPRPPIKSRILDEALALFAEKGYEGTTVQQLARAVGIRASSLYSHFRGKKAIFRAVFARALEGWKTALADVFSAAAGAPSLEESLVEMLHGYTRHATQGETYRFWARMYIFPPPVLDPKDRRDFEALDMEFAKGIGRFCAEGLGAAAHKARRAADPGRFLHEPSTADLHALAGSLQRLAWGFVICGQPDARALAAMKEEIRSGVRLILDGHRAAAASQKTAQQAAQKTRRKGKE